MSLRLATVIFVANARSLIVSRVLLLNCLACATAILLIWLNAEIIIYGLTNDVKIAIALTKGALASSAATTAAGALRVYRRHAAAGIALTPN